MKISELVDKLNKVKETFGDLRVETETGFNYTVTSISVIDEDGHVCSERRKEEAYSVWIE